MWRYRLFCICLSVCVYAKGLRGQVLQNMVQNPSFEVYKQLPSDLGQLPQVVYWSSPTLGSPDYFSTKGEGEQVRAPKNRMGETLPSTGYAYAGFYAYASRYIKRNFREYVQVQLKHAMHADEDYCIKVKIYLSEASNRALRSLGVAGTQLPLEEKHEENVQGRYAYLLAEDRGYIDQREWVELRATYRAKGGERYLTIGNFESDKDSDVAGAIEIPAYRNPHVDFAYYYIDDVCATSLKTNKDCACGAFDYIATQGKEVIRLDMAMRQKVFKKGDKKILETVEFERGKAIMLPGAHKALNELAFLLKKYPKTQIEVSGHTDDSGKPQDNQVLSKRRAQTVKNYLVSSGVHATQIKIRGYGQARPLTLNNTAENRARNERIEYKVIGELTQ